VPRQVGPASILHAVPGAPAFIMLIDDVLIVIFGFLESPVDLVRCERVCKDWYRCCSTPQLWKDAFERNWDPWNQDGKKELFEFRFVPLIEMSAA
jgi:hypothetical protein